MSAKSLRGNELNHWYNHIKIKQNTTICIYYRIYCISLKPQPVQCSSIATLQHIVMVVVKEILYPPWDVLYNNAHQFLEI